MDIKNDLMIEEDYSSETHIQDMNNHLNNYCLQKFEQSKDETIKELTENLKITSYEAQSLLLDKTKNERFQKIKVNIEPLQRARAERNELDSISNWSLNLPL